MSPDNIVLGENKLSDRVNLSKRLLTPPQRIDFVADVSAALTKLTGDGSGQLAALYQIFSGNLISSAGIDAIAARLKSANPYSQILAANLLTTVIRNILANGGEESAYTEKLEGARSARRLLAAIEREASVSEAKDNILRADLELAIAHRAPYDGIQKKIAAIASLEHGRGIAATSHRSHQSLELEQSYWNARAALAFSKTNGVGISPVIEQASLLSTAERQSFIRSVIEGADAQLQATSDPDIELLRDSGSQLLAGLLKLGLTPANTVRAKLLECRLKSSETPYIQAREAFELALDLPKSSERVQLLSQAAALRTRIELAYVDSDAKAAHGAISYVRKALEKEEGISKTLLADVALYEAATAQQKADPVAVDEAKNYLLRLYPKGFINSEQIDPSLSQISESIESQRLRGMAGTAISVAAFVGPLFFPTANTHLGVRSFHKLQLLSGGELHLWTLRDGKGSFTVFSRDGVRFERVKGNPIEFVRNELPPTALQNPEGIRRARGMLEQPVKDYTKISHPEWNPKQITVVSQGRKVVVEVSDGPAAPFSSGGVTPEILPHGARHDRGLRDLLQTRLGTKISDDTLPYFREWLTSLGAHIRQFKLEGRGRNTKERLVSITNPNAEGHNIVVELDGKRVAFREDWWMGQRNGFSIDPVTNLPGEPKIYVDNGASLFAVVKQRLGSDIGSNANSYLWQWMKNRGATVSEVKPPVVKGSIAATETGAIYDFSRLEVAKVPGSHNYDVKLVKYDGTVIEIGKDLPYADLVGARVSFSHSANGKSSLLSISLDELVNYQALFKKLSDY